MQLQIDKLGKVAITVEENHWSLDKDYDRLTVVEAPNNEYKTYISRKPVPAGTVLTNREYWIPFSSLKEEIVIDFNSFVSSLTEAMQQTKDYTNEVIDQGIEDITAIKEEAMRIITYIAENGIDSTVLAPNSVTSEKIQANAVIAGKIAPNAVVGGNIAANAVIAGNIAPNAVIAGNIAPETVTGSNIAEKTIDATRIKDKTIAGVNIKDRTIGTDQLSGGMYNGVMTPPCITTEKIADWQPDSEDETGITTDKIADSAVTEAKIANGAVTTDKISGVDSEAGAAITGPKIANGAITEDKIDPELWEYWEEHVDVAPTAGSVLPVQSGGVYEEVCRIENKIDGIDNVAISDDEEEITILGINNEVLARLNGESSDFKNLKNNGKDVLVGEDIEEIQNDLSEINETLSGINETMSEIDKIDIIEMEEEIIFSSDEGEQISKISFGRTYSDEAVEFIDSSGNLIANVNNGGIYAINIDDKKEEKWHEGLNDFQRPICDINLFGVYGQSLSTGQQDCPELSRENYKGNLMIGQYEWVAGSADVQLGASFAPLVARSINQLGQDYIPSGTADQTNGETASINSCNAAKELLDRYVLNMIDRKFLAGSFGVGGISIELLSKGCPNNSGAYYAKLERAVNIIKASADSANKSVCCTAIAWMQGEWNEDSHEDMGWTDGTPSTHDKNDYKAYLIGGTTSGGVTVNGMVNDLCDTFKTKFVQTNNPIILGTQMSEWYIGYRSLPIMMAQLEASNESKKYLVCTPTYRVTDRRGHLDANGERWIGEFFAKVWYKKVVLGIDWKPLQPKKIIRFKNFIIIDFYVTEPPLVFDTMQVRPVSNYGFKVYDSDGEKTIKSVSIISATKVRIDVSSNFSGDIEVTYAGQGVGYGNLRDSDPWISFEKYKDLDTIVENPAGVSYHPDFEPKDKDGNVIYNKNYPCQNFCLNFYYKIVDGEKEIVINI